jgi:hypothetical protein
MSFTEAAKASIQTFAMYADLLLKEKIDRLTVYLYTMSITRIDLGELFSNELAI